MPYSNRAKENLVREGIPHYRIFVTGNPINEVLNAYQKQIDENGILQKLNLNKKKYFLVTLHREENVDTADRLRNFVNAFEQLGDKYQIPLIWSVHPRTRKRLTEFNIDLKNRYLKLSDPLGFFEFVKLEKNAFCVLSDSGTVIEECGIFQIPLVTIRDTTERQETLDVGSNILSGDNPESIIRCVAVVTQSHRSWQAPPEYLAEHVSDTVINILLGTTFFKYSRI